MKKKIFDQPILMMSFAMVLFMASTEAPLLVSIFTVVVLLWKWASERRGLFKLPRKLTAALSFLLLVQVYIQYRSLFGQESSNTLLMGLSALKIMDYESERDHKFLILMGFIMIAMKAIFTIDFYWLAPSALAFIGLWYAMLDAQFHKKNLFLGRVFLASLPLSLILFIAFPRFVVPWALNQAQPVGIVGFSDSLSPGEVAELASQDRLVFRASFPNSDHVGSSFYWRGAVLTQSDGLKWSVGPPQLRKSRRLRSEGGFRYTVILEPGTMGYLFTLNYPKRVSANSIPISELRHSVFRTFRSLNKPQTYEVVSDDSLRDIQVPGPEFLDHPKLEGRVLAMVNEIKASTSTTKERLDRLRKFFSDPDFVYTLKPGVYAHNDLETFLFERKRGFCEHFAGSYATLARALEIPSRVVVGYQGGVFNLFGDFWRVSQQDAHAWVEVFVNDRWERVDPTQWVAPLRLSLGAQQFFNLSESDQVSLARSLGLRHLDQSQTSLWDIASFYFEDLNYQWTYFLLEFDSDSQRGFWVDLTKDFGIFLLASIAILVTSLVGVRRLLRLGSAKTPMRKILDHVILWSEKREFKYDLSAPPLVNLRRLQGQFPEQAEVLSAVAAVYDLNIYQEQPLEKKTLKRIQYLVKGLS